MHFWGRSSELTLSFSNMIRETYSYCGWWMLNVVRSDKNNTNTNTNASNSKNSYSNTTQHGMIIDGNMGNNVCSNSNDTCMVSNVARPQQIVAFSNASKTRKTQEKKDCKIKEYCKKKDFKTHNIKEKMHKIRNNICSIQP